MQTVSCDKVKELLSQGGQLVDVRTPMEFYQGALPGALNIPLQTIQAATEQLDPKRPVLLYCRSGARTRTAAMWLNSMGFTEVIDLGAGGYYVDCITEAPAAASA